VLKKKKRIASASPSRGALSEEVLKTRRGDSAKANEEEREGEEN